MSVRQDARFSSVSYNLPAAISGHGYVRPEDLVCIRPGSHGKQPVYYRSHCTESLWCCDRHNRCADCTGALLPGTIIPVYKVSLPELHHMLGNNDFSSSSCCRGHFLRVGHGAGVHGLGLRISHPLSAAMVRLPLSCLPVKRT